MSSWEGYWQLRKIVVSRIVIREVQLIHGSPKGTIQKQIQTVFLFQIFKLYTT